MSFHYSRSRPTQHLLVGGLLLAAVVAGTLPATQAAYHWLVATFDDLTLLVLGPLVVHLATFWTLALLFLQADDHDRPGFVARHRIQQGKPRKPSMARTLKVLAMNQLVYSPILLALLGWFLIEVRGWTASPELPGVGRLLLELAGLGVAAVIVFYASHRFLHRPWWMKKVHRVHHEFRTSTALASEYAHPFEFTLANFGVLAAGVVIFAPHLVSILLFTLLAVTTIVVHHSGYAVPWAPWAVPHDWHHYRYTELFGTIGVLDRLFGTDREFRTMKDGDTR